MVKRFFRCCLHFIIIIYVVPAVLLLARLSMQFADSAGNIAAGSLIQTNTFSFCIFRIFLLFSERGKELFHVTHMQTLMLHYLKGLLRYLPPFVSGLKGIRFLFAMCKRVLDTGTACKIKNICENKRVLHVVIKYLLAPCKRVFDCL
jgi:hypothetical protein